MKFKLSGYILVPHLERRQAGRWPWQRSVCSKCGGKVMRLTLGISRHAARELIENGILGGEAERLFHSTRDDLGWRVRGWGCLTCREFAPVELLYKQE
jgi:ribosomal protein S14